MVSANLEKKYCNILNKIVIRPMRDTNNSHNKLLQSCIRRVMKINVGYDNKLDNGDILNGTPQDFFTNPSNYRHVTPPHVG